MVVRLQASTDFFPLQSLLLKTELISMFLLFIPRVIMYSYDDKIACQKILDKKGLKGYQVTKHSHIPQDVDSIHHIWVDIFTCFFFMASTHLRILIVFGFVENLIFSVNFFF